MKLTYSIATGNKNLKQIEQEILLILKIERVELGKQVFYINIPKGIANATLECHLRDGIRVCKRAIDRLKFYKEDFEELTKNEKQSLSHIIECYKLKQSQLQNFLYQLKLDKKPKNKKNKAWQN